MSEEKSELPPVVWSKRGDVYSEEEAEQKHSLGNKETILVGNEVVRQMKEKERIEGEIKEKNIDPEELENTIDILKARHSELLGAFETDLQHLQTTLTSFMEK